MSKFFAIGLFLLVCVGSACRENQEDRQVDLIKGEGVDYLFDPTSEICVVVKNPISTGAVAWPVPCAKVKDKLHPSVRQQVEEMLKKLPAECPR